MSFIEDIKNCFGEDFLAGKIFKLTMFSDACYVENVSAVIGFSDEEIILSLKSGKLVLSGKNLYIKKYCGGDVAVCGKITRIERD